MARDLGFDLVEVADKADPPVCRIMDYGKYKYEQSQRAKESRKKSTHILVKEMKYRPKIGPGDFATKTRKVEEFLGDGSKVKVTIMFRGREMQHPNWGVVSWTGWQRRSSTSVGSRPTPSRRAAT